jgi:hypothetical protein
MVAGGANFPVHKKEQQNEARKRNIEEWQNIQGLLDKIRGTGMGGISADDPNAIDKLREKLSRLEAGQEHMKLANAHWRKHGTMAGFPGISEDEAVRIDAQMKTAYSWVQKNGPYESWKLSNNNANINRIRDRITALERKAETSLEGWEFTGGRVQMNIAENRLQIIFEGKPDAEIRTELKRHGFRWAPSQGAWQRQLTDNALYAARHIKAIQATAEPDTVDDSTQR